MKTSGFDISKELLIQPWYDGIKLIIPDSKAQLDTSINHRKLYNISEVFKLPLNVLFRNPESAILEINETAAETYGFSSIKESYKKIPHNVTTKKIADLIINEDENVLQKNKMIINEQPFIRLRDGAVFSSISLKFPWYNNSSKIIGLFSITFALGDYSTCSIATALTNIANIGLLGFLNHPTEKMQKFLGNRVDDVYLSKREMDCMHLLIRGKTAKMIGQILDISPRTVEHYLENIKDKLRVSNKAELIEKFIDTMSN